MSERHDGRLALLRESPATRGRTRQLEAAIHCSTCQVALRFTTDRDGHLRESCRCGERAVVPRVGELLAAFQAKAGRPKLGRAHAPITQRAAAGAAGLSKHDEKQARRVAASPATLGKAGFGRRLPDLRCGRHSA